MTQLQRSKTKQKNTSSSVLIGGIGTASPARVSQALAAKLASRICCADERQALWLDRVFTRTGIEYRGSVLAQSGLEPMAKLEAFYPEPTDPEDRGPTTAQRMALYALHAPALAHTAGRRALDDAAVEPANVTHLVTASCTGFFAPGLDVALIKSLGLSPDVSRLHVGFMGCHAAFNAIGAARAISESDSQACVLVVCVELCSLHFSYGWDPGRLIANALFADGAAAAVISQKAKFQQIQTDAQPGPRFAVQSLSSRLLPDSSDAMTWVIGDHGFEMTLAANVPSLIADHLGPWCEKWLGESDLDIQSVSQWAVHPGGPKVLSAISNTLGLTDDALNPSRKVLADQGNMSSATILFILDEIRQSKSSGPVACIGLGPGLMAEGMLLMSV